MEWWIWILLGLSLVLAELITPGGFYILFFGIGAIFLGGLAGCQSPARIQPQLKTTRKSPCG